MILLVTGGSGSGKSAYAETRVKELSGNRRIYLATMQVRDEESRRRVARHVAMRADKGFESLECPCGIGKLAGDPLLNGAVVLLEDLSNLLANEMFAPDADPTGAADRILEELLCLERVCAGLVVVTNEIFSEPLPGDPSVQAYIKALGFLNTALAQRAEETVEVVYGIPCIRALLRK